MLKFIGNIIRFVFFVYVVVVIIVLALYHANKKYYGGTYTNVAGYTIFNPENDYLEPDIKSGDVVIIRLSNPNIYYNEGDYVLIEHNGYARLEKIIKDNKNDTYVVNFTNKPKDLPTAEEEENTTIKNDDNEVIKYKYTEEDFEDKTLQIQGLKGKAILYGEKVNEWYGILTSWWLLGIMILYLFLFPTLFYKRYKEV